MDTKVFVFAGRDPSPLFPGWRAALAVRGRREGKNPFTGGPMLLPTWDPTPGAPFPPEARRPFESLPGRSYGWSARRFEGFVGAMTARAERRRTRPTLLGPDESKVHHVSRAALEALLARPEPTAQLAERVARWEAAMGHADEHGEEPPLPGDAYFDLPLDEVRARTFRVEDLEERESARWTHRIDATRAAVEDIVALTRSLGEGDEVFYVAWNPPEEEEPPSEKPS